MPPVSFTVLLMVILRGFVEERLRSEAAKSVSADGVVAWEDLGSAACSAVAPGMAGLGLTDTGPQETHLNNMFLYVSILFGDPQKI